MNLNQVTVYSTDVERAVAFYKTLGFKLIVNSIPHYARFECPNGDSTFSLHNSDKTIHNNSVTLYFECKDVDEEFRRLNDLGIEFDLAPRDQEWLWREACLKDPDGNSLIIYTAGENRKNPPWRVSG